MAATSNNPLKTIEPYFTTKAPYQLPTNVKEALVKYVPWIDLVLLVILSPAILLVLGLGTFSLPFSTLGGVDAVAGLSVAVVALVIQVVLMVAALPGLFNRKLVGWNLSFYGVVFNLIYSLLTWQVLGGLVSAVLGAYILFQIKSYYK